MDHQTAQQLARELMDRHGLNDWSFRWGRGKRTLGSCSEARKTITLSAYYVAMNDQEHVRNTILHEIAHALAGAGNGHNGKWKTVCRRIGADPKRLDRTARTPEAPYELYCPLCRTVVAPRHRRIRDSTLKRMGCRQCGRASFGKLVFRARESIDPGD